MSVQARLETKIRHGLAPAHLEVVNESGSHNVPPGSETHFKVVVVAEGFEGRNLVQRHRMVYGLVQDELADGVHALALHTYTAADWARAHGAAPDSPNCRGGKAREG